MPNTKHHWIMRLLALVGVCALLMGSISTISYNTIQDEGSALTQRQKLNFIGAGVTCADDSGNNRTNCTISGGGSTGYNQIQDEGSNLTQRTILNFTGAGVTCTDDSGNSRTNCDIPGGGTGGLSMSNDQFVTDGTNYWGPLARMFPPALTTFSWLNQLDCVGTVFGGLYVIQVPFGTTEICGRMATPPAATFTASVFFVPAGISSKPSGGCIQTSDGTKIVALCMDANTGQPRIHGERWNNGTSYNADIFERSPFNAPQSSGWGIWLRIQETATNRVFSYSVDGASWLTLFTESVTTFLTTTQVGFSLENTNQISSSNGSLGMSVYSFEMTNP